MNDVSCKLLSSIYESDEIGNEIKTPESKEFEIPIIEVEDVWLQEFYEANKQGLKPSLRLRVSSLNYNGEEELIYMNVKYSIIRAPKVNDSEIALVCVRSN